MGRVEKGSLGIDVIVSFFALNPLKIMCFSAEAIFVMTAPGGAGLLLI